MPGEPGFFISSAIASRENREVLQLAPGSDQYACYMLRISRFARSDLHLFKTTFYEG